jgi:DNA-binding HxlR family transcriptional regulator
MSAFHNATLYAGFVQRTSFEDVTCSVAQCLDVVGEWWSLLIVRDAFLGVTRFDDFQARLGISRNILAQRLNRLVANEILKRVPYQDHPPRSEYRLTAKGRDLWHVVTAMRQWGDRWAAPGGPPVETRHTACGHIVTALPTCSNCGEPLDARSVTAIPGPGASEGDFDRTAVARLGTLPSGAEALSRRA